jgi:prephenate dehydrogenase
MDTAPAAARDRVAAFWVALGARVVLRDPARHDAEVAWTSHVPHALAFAFARALAAAPAGALELQGSGFRDFTRIAHSDPELWADILIGNRKSLEAPLQAAARALAELAGALEAEDAEALERFIAAGRAALSDGDGRGSHAAAREPEPPTAGRPGGTKDVKKHS